jgi:hypothetical protein
VNATRPLAIGVDEADMSLFGGGWQVEYTSLIASYKPWVLCRSVEHISLS